MDERREFVVSAQVEQVVHEWMVDRDAEEPMVPDNAGHAKGLRATIDLLDRQSCHRGGDAGL
jgi:hypothetical protein